MRFFRILEQYLHYLHITQIKAIKYAYVFAHKAHRHQQRHSKEPYITHPVAVACILAEMHFDAETLISALLHDVIEDTLVTREDVVKNFGPSIAKLVDGVSKITQIECKNHIDAKARSLRKVILATAEDVRVIIIKLADRLHNMRTLQLCSLLKQKRIAQETLDIFAPIAKRLGMHKIALELEELCFIALYPKRHHILKQVLKKLRHDRKTSLKQLKFSMITYLKKHYDKPFKIIAREKQLYSIYKKMRDKKISFHEIYDVYAFRIVIDDTETNCYQLLGLLHALHKPIPSCFKDYIATPKNNGYQSLHTILFGPFSIPIEIQIRTEFMDYQANHGIAAHWLYKSNEPTLKQSELLSQQWMQNLLALHQYTDNSAEFLKNVKIELFPNEIYVFTPKGKILTLPKGATVIDFAYAIHTDIGNTCFAAKIDRIFVPLYTKLKNSQTIQVLTTPKSYPNPAWLDFIVTKKARHSVEKTLKAREQKDAILLGKQMLKQALHMIEANTISKIPKKNIAHVLQEIGVTHLHDLYTQIALGHQMAIFIAHRLVHPHKIYRAKPGEQPISLTIRGTENFVIHFAPCCYPIPGDPIVGNIELQHGLVVHHAHCATIKHSFDYSSTYQHVPIHWAKNIQKTFKVILEIQRNDQPLQFERLALAVSQHDAHIDEIKSTTRNKNAKFLYLEVSTQNTKQIEKIIETIQCMQAIVSVHRKINRDLTKEGRSQ